MASEDSGGDAGVGRDYAEGAQPLDVLPLHSTDLLTLLDVEGIVRYESPSIERLYGFDQDELVGEQVAEYFHPADRERVLAAFEAVVSGEDHHVEAVEYRHRQADGSYKWIESVASSNPTPAGNYVVNSRDISERKERERDLRRAQEQVQSERDGKEAIRELLLETSADGEIATSVCRLLVESYGYEAAWVVRGGDQEDDQSMVTVASHGTDRESWRTNGSEPRPFAAVTRRALDSGETETVTPESDHHRATADRLLEHGLASVRAVPLTHDGITDGALTVLRRDAEAGVATQLVSEFASALAFKRQVNRRQEALVAETVTELELRITDDHFLAALSTAPDVPSEADLSAEELHRDDDCLVTYLLAGEGVDAAMLQTAGERLDATYETALVTDGNPDSVVRTRVEGPTVGRVLSGHGGALQSIAAGDGCVDVTVHLPRRTDVPSVIDSVRGHWPEATMRSRNERDVDRERPTAFGSLTEKQEDALRAATLAGFFERPQGASAADIAETLGVSRSTFLYHLRNAERKVFADAFGHE
jgi:PAS domain S-box-containing protein